MEVHKHNKYESTELFINSIIVIKLIILYFNLSFISFIVYIFTKIKKKIIRKYYKTHVLSLLSKYNMQLTNH